MNRIALIIPGFQKSGRRKEYRAIAEMFKRQKIKPVIVNIRWNNRTMSQWISEFLGQYRTHTDEKSDVCILGFSYGAMIALLTALMTKPKILMLCSLSPFFKEDLSRIPKQWITSIGKRRVKDFQNLSFNNAVKHFKNRTFLFIGSEESKLWEPLRYRINQAKKKIKNQKLIMVDGAGHKLQHSEYQKAVAKIICTL